MAFTQLVRRVGSMKSPFRIARSVGSKMRKLKSRLPEITSDVYDAMDSGVHSWSNKPRKLPPHLGRLLRGMR